MVVSPGLTGGSGAGGVPRYDIAYQLNEIEARVEDFAEALAFVRLLNALLRASGGALPDGGRPYAHLTAFVRVDVLGSLHQRAFQCACLPVCSFPRACIGGFGKIPCRSAHNLTYTTRGTSVKQADGMQQNNSQSRYLRRPFARADRSGRSGSWRRRRWST